MRIFKKAVSCILILTFLLSLFPVSSFAEESDEYRISNEYLSFMFNKKTGGFAIETAEGNPGGSFFQKKQYCITDIPSVRADREQGHFHLPKADHNAFPFRFSYMLTLRTVAFPQHIKKTEQFIR